MQRAFIITSGLGYFDKPNGGIGTRKPCSVPIVLGFAVIRLLHFVCFFACTLCAKVPRAVQHIVTACVQNLKIINVYACLPVILAEKETKCVTADSFKRNCQLRPIRVAFFSRYQLSQALIVAAVCKVQAFCGIFSAALDFKFQGIFTGRNIFYNIYTHIALFARVYKVQRAHIVSTVFCYFDIAGRCIRSASGVGSVPPVGRITVGNSRGL